MIKLGEHIIYVRSMGKALKVIAIAESITEANAYMAKHDNAALIAEVGTLLMLADKWDHGVPIREEPQQQRTVCERCLGTREIAQTDGYHGDMVTCPACAGMGYAR